MSWNRGAQRLFGYPDTDVLNRPYSIIFTSDDIASGEPQQELTRALIGNPIDHERWHIRRDGSRFWGTNTLSPMYNATGELFGFTKVVRDITTSFQAFKDLSTSEAQLRVLFESVHGYAIVSLESDGTVNTWNPGAEQVFGYSAADVLGQSIAMLYGPDDVSNELPATILETVSTAGVYGGERWMHRKDGTTALISLQIRRLKSVHDASIDGLVMIAHDITQHNAVRQELHNQAYHDELTALPNRRTFFDHMKREIATLKRNPSHQFAVLYIDVDRFKEVNDGFGHLIADDVLISLSRRFERCVRAQDVVARIGGDEFAILVKGISTTADAYEAATRIKSDLEYPVQIGATRLTASVSIGIAFADLADDSPEAVLRKADAAMYAAKHNGRARAEVFSALTPLDRPFHSVKPIFPSTNPMRDLSHALERNELRAVYQPIFKLSTRTISGFEALAHWQHPSLGLVSAATFISYAQAQEYLVAAIDHWMLERACEQGVKLHNYPTDLPLQVSVNVSGQAFSRPDFVSEIEATLHRTGFSAESLRLRITQSAILGRSDHARDVLCALRALGIKIDVNDFGTGYASLDALNHLIVDGLKIESPFVTKLHSRDGATLVATIIKLAHRLGVVAIAEGIDTTLQLKQLISLECDSGQGALLAPPLDADSAAALVAHETTMYKLV